MLFCLYDFVVFNAKFGIYILPFFLSLGSRDAFVSDTRVSYAAVNCSRRVGTLLACDVASMASSAALFGAAFAAFCFCLLARVAPDGPAAPWGFAPGLPWPLIVGEGDELELSDVESVSEHGGSEVET